MIGRFEELLHALGKVFHLELHVDRFSACSIQVHDDLIIQLQLDASQENLWIFSKLIELPPGKFRENVLAETLKANGLPDPVAATFGYITASASLAMFQQYPLNILNGDRLAGILGSFLDMASQWRAAIAAGQTAPSPGRRK